MATSISSVPFPMSLNNNYNIKDDDHNKSPNSLLRNDHRYDLNNKIMLTAIVSLSGVVLLVVALHVYARYSLRRHHRQRRETVLRRITALSLSTPASEPRQGNNKPGGLDAAAIAALPGFKPPGTGDIDCAVCLGAMTEEGGDRSENKLLPGCSHAFHAECIGAWLASQASCPVCRAVVDPRLVMVMLPEPREGPSAAASTSSGKVLSSSSRFSSFRRIITRERSSSSVSVSCRLDDQVFIDEV